MYDDEGDDPFFVVNTTIQQWGLRRATLNNIAEELGKVTYTLKFMYCNPTHEDKWYKNMF